MRKFLQNLLGSLVRDAGNQDPEFNKLIAPQPGLQERRGSLPRNRRTCPFCVAGGIRTMAFPSTVGTSIFAPSAASTNVTGTTALHVVSGPREKRMRANIGDDIEIAAGPPYFPASPLPGTALANPC